ncbi:hypothetical protein [Desulfoluna spongiiphila]|uniref:hypothetical protein n=1 Tax=Desulfoluna spongiiphila TaxID=419481 RepID=UPI001C315E68|nr:hypothetical protein [Desulfoluna spongiiphila]
MQCLDCLHVFPRPSKPKAPVAIFSMWVLGVTVLPFLSVVLLSNVPGTMDAVPNYYVIRVIEAFVQGHPKIVSISIAITLISISLLCVGAYTVSNILYRRKIKARQDL